ncbi:hypothetical protein CEP52_014360 [Fusarium oligoseptatum]|uniref:Heterokaryon incompatibility domain-containing protein n=1 Tax=Fusarium oligoseptatum TaxID=2604345 RepID=A0A428SMP1_9HYPO|nr:hypothetical protein CEP52_014360 [Fusarium oligoseptatum]
MDWFPVRMGGGSSESRADVILNWTSASSGQKQHVMFDILGERENDIPWPGFRVRPCPAVDANSQECVEFIQSHLDACDEGHGTCDKWIPKTINDADQGATRPSRLLEIVNESGDLGLLLKDATNIEGNYTALSHCWGTLQEAQKIPILTKDNIAERLSHVFLASNLSRTFQDAVHLTDRLGLRYIWIDSLCIIQGDKEDWNSECRKMAYVYGSAYLVIGAAYAKDGNGGLYAPRQLRRVEFRTPTGQLVKAVVEDATKSRVEHNAWGSNRKFWEAKNLPLLTRAWVFQERMLARRTIYFAASELVWECRSKIDCECSEMMMRERSGQASSVKTHYHYVFNRCTDLARFDIWHDIAAQYSSRAITHHRDRLPALASIAKQVNNHGECVCLGRYLCGIWEQTLPDGLLWSADYQSATQVPNGTNDEATHIRSTNTSIPSWSWLSIEGRVRTSAASKQALVRITGIDYVLASDDPYGECTRAEIKLVGRVVPVDIFISTATHQVVVRARNSREERPLVADTRPFECSGEQLAEANMVVLQVGYFVRMGNTLFWYCCLILQHERDGTNRYRRVGIAHVSKQAFASADEESIVLV